MPDDADIAGSAIEVLLEHDIKRVRNQGTFKALPRADGLCCNDCDDPAMINTVMTALPNANPKRLKAGQEIRQLDGVNTVFGPIHHVTRFCSKECAADHDLRTRPPGTVGFGKNA